VPPWLRGEPSRRTLGHASLSPSHPSWLRGEHRRRQRQGVILLVVLAILALFVVIGLSFVLLATQERQAARLVSKVEQRGNHPKVLLDGTIEQILRGSLNPRSVLGPHSLLEDMYGNDSVFGVIPGSGGLTPVTNIGYADPTAADVGFRHRDTPVTGTPALVPANYVVGRGAMLYLYVPIVGIDGAPGIANFDDDNETPPNADNATELGLPTDHLGRPTDDFSILPSHYNGRVITMLDGAAAGKSTRITGYEVLRNAADNPLVARIRMLPFEGMQVVETAPSVFAWLAEGAPAPGDRFIINGREFNGPGFGYDPSMFATGFSPGTDKQWGVADADDDGDGYKDNRWGTNRGPDSQWGAAGVDDDGNGTTDDATEAGLGDDIYTTESGMGTNNDVATEAKLDFGLPSIWFPTYFQSLENFLPRPPADDRVLPLALLPNYADPEISRLLRLRNIPVQVIADEDYDAVDFQNMLLAMRVSTGKPAPQGNPPTVTTMPNTYLPTRVVMPSLHRPDLINYWMTRINALSLPEPERTRLRRKFILRPLVEDHTKFNGSNPDYNEITGPWDVDNDGDGQADSIWVDVGLPPETNKDGQLVKPLVAILCLDQDSKLNLNAHGSPHHYRRKPPDANNVTDEKLTTRELNDTDAANNFDPTQPDKHTDFKGPIAGGTDAQDVELPVGMGYSVAEINLGVIMPPPYALQLNNGDDPNWPQWDTVNELRQLLEGVPERHFKIDPVTLSDLSSELAFPPIPGRYGEPQLLQGPPGDRANRPGPRPGFTSTYTYIPANDNPKVDKKDEWGFAKDDDLGFNGDDDGDGVIDNRAEAGRPGSRDQIWSTARLGDDNLPVSAMEWVQPSLPGSPVDHFRGNYLTELRYVSKLGHRLREDLDGNGGLALDVRGQPYYWNVGTPNPNVQGLETHPTSGDTNQLHAVPESIDEPWEIDLSLSATYQRSTVEIDRPYEPAELEYLLRAGNVDARTLSDRLAHVAPRFTGADGVDPQWSAYARSLATTESWDVPVATFTPTREMREALATKVTPAAASTNLNFLDLLRAKLAQVSSTTISQGDLANLISVILRDREGREMIAPELLAGLRMDLNRPFGNNSDDEDEDGGSPDTHDHTTTGFTQNGVIDEPSESERDELWDLSAVDSVTTVNDEIYVDNNNDGRIDSDDRRARYVYTKQLFVLMMLLKDKEYDMPSSEYAQGTHEAEQLTARRIAQWCVNVVDFRDPDSIMTPFEYDPNPFDGGPGPDNIWNTNDDKSGWDVDGWVGVMPGPDGSLVTPPNPPSPDDGAPPTQRGLVWGCEQPLVLITETLAFHDLRQGYGSNTPPNPVQKHMPQGSAFIELYCTRNAHDTALPDNAVQPRFRGELIDPLGRLDLGLLAPEDGGLRYPVWRLVVSGAAAANHNDVRSRLATNPDSTTCETEGLPATHFPAVSNIDIDRVVWFTRQGPTTHQLWDRIYFNQSPGQPTDAVPIGPGQFVVIGPYREPEQATDPKSVTRIGWTDTSVGKTPPQKITVPDATTAAPIVVANNPQPYPVVGDQIQRPVGIPVAGQQDSATTPSTQYVGLVGLSISEPLFTSYYTLPDTADADRAMAMGPLTPNDPIEAIERLMYLPNTPVKDTTLTTRGTTPPASSHRTVLLQRLADPTVAWNPETNPYLTVDWMPIDLTVFNGEPGGPPNDYTSGTWRFASRQRDIPANGSLWTMNSRDPVVSKDDPAYKSGTNLINHFTHALVHTLGFTNLPFTDPAQPVLAAGSRPMGWHWLYDPTSPPWIHDSNLDDYIPTATTTEQRIAYIGDPAPYPLKEAPMEGQAPDGTTTKWKVLEIDTTQLYRVFPWLTWNNRPFANAMELLNVPASSAARLLFDYRMRQSGDDHYEGGSSAPPYKHLLNLFLSSNINDDPNLESPPASGLYPAAKSNYHRLLEFVTVPSRFSGTEKLLDPRVFRARATVGGGVPSTVPEADAYLGEFYPYYAPFNRVSNYRDPGRVNINTIFDDGSTLSAILNNYPGTRVTYDASGNPIMSALWEKIWRSRSGFDSPPAGGDLIWGNANDFSPALPTVFGNPFRSFSNAYHVPIEALRFRGATATPRDFVEGSLLRRDPSADSGTSNRPLFAFSGNPSNAFNDPATPPAIDPAPYINTDRNPYFRYQVLSKLSNMLTTRSNVYAVWITVGYFEVEQVPVDDGHPDGYRLGAEVGMDTGEIKRHRAFYIIDRSRPVAFERGRDHNSQDAIVLRRFIE